MVIKKKDSYIHVRCNEETKVLLDRLCKYSDRSQSYVVAKALEYYNKTLVENSLVQYSSKLN